MGESRAKRREREKKRKELMDANKLPDTPIRMTRLTCNRFGCRQTILMRSSDVMLFTSGGANYHGCGDGGRSGWYI